MRGRLSTTASPKRNFDKYYVPALEKGLDVLEALAFSPAPQSLSELARTLKRTSSELFRMLSALEKRRYIERDQVSSKYSLTLRLYELAHTHSPVEKLLRAAALPMRALAARLEESCHISTLTAGRLMVLAEAESPSVYRFSVEVGSTFSAVNTASGRLLLSCMTAEEFEDWARHCSDHRRLNAAARSKLRAKLREIRRSGVSTAHNEPVIGVRSYAVLLGNPDTDLRAALAVASLDMRNKKENPRLVLKSLGATAAEINRSLGLRAESSPIPGKP
jgi:DNA-binding IclR family transcriptional regulator